MSFNKVRACIYKDIPDVATNDDEIPMHVFEQWETESSLIGLPALVEHNEQDRIGVITEFELDKVGRKAFVTFTLTGENAAKERARSIIDVKASCTGGMSISSTDKMTEASLRHLMIESGSSRRYKAMEVSVCSKGMRHGTEITDVKASSASSDGDKTRDICRTVEGMFTSVTGMQQQPIESDHKDTAIPRPTRGGLYTQDDVSKIVAEALRLHSSGARQAPPSSSAVDSVRDTQPVAPTSTRQKRHVEQVRDEDESDEDELTKLLARKEKEYHAAKRMRELSDKQRRLRELEEEAKELRYQRQIEEDRKMIASMHASKPVAEKTEEQANVYETPTPSGEDKKQPDSVQEKQPQPQQSSTTASFAPTHPSVVASKLDANPEQPVADPEPMQTDHIEDGAAKQDAPVARDKRDAGQVSDDQSIGKRRRTEEPSKAGSKFDITESASVFDRIASELPESHRDAFIQQTTDLLLAAKKGHDMTTRVNNEKLGTMYDLMLQMGGTPEDAKTYCESQRPVIERDPGSLDRMISILQGQVRQRALGQQATEDVHPAHQPSPSERSVSSAYMSAMAAKGLVPPQRVVSVSASAASQNPYGSSHAAWQGAPTMSRADEYMKRYQIPTGEGIAPLDMGFGSRQA